MGDIAMRDRRPANAISKYEQALQVRERLNSAAPQAILIRHDLAEVWIKIGDATRLTGTPNQALQYYVKGLEILESLSTAFTANTGVRDTLKEVYSRVGQMNLAIASDRLLPVSKRVEYLQAARSALKRSLDIAIDLRDRNLRYLPVLDRIADSPEQIASQIAKCDAALEGIDH